MWWCVRAGDTVKTRQAVVQYRKYRGLFFHSLFPNPPLCFVIQICVLTSGSYVLARHLVACIVMVSGLMGRRDLDSTAGLTSGQPGKTHAERKEGAC